MYRVLGVGFRLDTQKDARKKQVEPPIRVYVGIILGFYRGYIGIMENRMETTI